MQWQEAPFDLRRINPLTLAFIGDGVYEMLAREEVVRRYTSLSPDRLHRRTVEMVRASAQAAAFLLIEPLLGEPELAVFKRGRNASGVTPPRHSTTAQYRSATGLEALFGWLYLKGKNERIRELFRVILSSNSCLDGGDDEPLGGSDGSMQAIPEEGPAD